MQQLSRKPTLSAAVLSDHGRPLPSRSSALASVAVVVGVERVTWHRSF